MIRHRERGREEKKLKKAYQRKLKNRKEER